MKTNLKRLLSLLAVFALVLTAGFAGAVPAAAASSLFSLTVDGAAAEAVSAGTETCPVEGSEVDSYTLTVSPDAKELTVSLNGSDPLTDVYADLNDLEETYIEVIDGSAVIDLQKRYVYLCMISDSGELYHLHLSYDGEAAAPDAGDEPASAPFTATVNGTEMTGITEGTLTWTDWSGNTSDVTCYTVPVPEGSTEATLILESEMQVAYYSSSGEWLAYVGGDSSMTVSAEHTVALQDSNGDGELDGISVQTPESYSTDYYILFVYAAAGSEEETACLTVLESAPTTGTTTAGALYELDLGTVFAESESHDVTYSFACEVSNQHTKITDGYFCFSTSTPGSYAVTLTAECGEASVSHELTVTVDEASEGIAAQYGYDETAKSSVTVYVTLSNNGYPITAVDGTVMANLAVTVPYFDLGLYGLQDFYRYGTDNNQGPYTTDTVVQRPTGLHLYIYLLERYYMGLDESKCCLGTSGVLSYTGDTEVLYMDGELAYESGGKRALLTSGGATSIYMVNFWGHDENLMYFRNHCYPLMSAGWGSTSDYILLSDGDAWDVGMFSNWSFNRNGKFSSFNQNVYTADPGESVTLSTLSWGTSASATNFQAMTGLNVGLYNSDWERIEKLTYTSGNTLTFTAPEEAGTYYLLGLDSNYKDATNSNVAPAAARLVVGGGSESGATDITSYYEDYDFISIKDDQGRYLVDIQADSIETQYNGTVPTHQVTIEEGTETVYVTFPSEIAFVEYTGTYSVSGKADSGYGNNVSLAANEDGTVTVGIPVADYTDTDTGIYLENESYAFVYGFDFTIGEITKVEVGTGTPVSRILLNTYATTLIYNKEESKTAQLTATVLPAEATGWTIEWTSSDETVATVDENGLVTALAAGETVITAAIGEIKAECTVTVEKFNSAPTVVSGTADRAKVMTDTACTLDAAAMFTDAEGDALTYTAEVCEATALGDSWDYTYTAIEGFDAAVTDGKLTVSFPEIGIYAVKLTASDGKLSTTHTYQFTVVDNDSGVIRLNDGVTMDLYNVVAVGASEEFVEDYEIPYKGTHDTTIHHIVLSKDTVSGGPNRKMDVTVASGYYWGQYGAAGKETSFSTRADIGIFASDPDHNVTAHFLQFHTECETHTDEDHDAICEVCTLDFSCDTCKDADSDGYCDACGKQLETDIAYGDIDGNGTLDMADTSLVMQYVNGTSLTEAQLAAADVDGSGTVDMTDISMILQYINGIITGFPAET